jgi:hypothetical protein
MTHDIKPLIKKIDELSTQIFKLGGYKGVNQLKEQNRHLVKTTSALKEQDRIIHELDTSTPP